MMDLAHVATEDALLNAITRAEHQITLDAAIDKAHQRLAQAADGEREDALRKDAAEASLDTIAIELDDLSMDMEPKKKSKKKPPVAANKPAAPSKRWNPEPTPIITLRPWKMPPRR